MPQCTNFNFEKYKILGLTAIRVKIGYSSANKAGAIKNNIMLLRILYHSPKRLSHEKIHFTGVYR